MKNNIPKYRLVMPVLVLMVLFILPAFAAAQKFEINPYAGGFLPGKWAGMFDMRNAIIVGVKGGTFVTDTLELEANFGYINYLDFAGTRTKTMGMVWEGMASYNFAQAPRFAMPYATFGLGGLTTTWSNDNRRRFGRPEMETSDTFLSMSYGGGIKTLRIWGPVGYRADIRGRTLPNFYGRQLSSLEITSGLTFSWGER